MPKITTARIVIATFLFGLSLVALGLGARNGWETSAVVMGFGLMFMAWVLPIVFSAWKD